MTSAKPKQTAAAVKRRLRRRRAEGAFHWMPLKKLRCQMSGKMSREVASVQR